MTKPTNDLYAQRRLRSDQSLCCALYGWLRTQRFFMRTAKTLVSLGRCPCSYQFSMGARVILLVLSVDWLISSESHGLLRNEDDKHTKLFYTV